MARYFTPIDIQTLSNHIAAALRKIKNFDAITNYYEKHRILDTPTSVELALEYLFKYTTKGFNDKMIKDLNKVYFDTENLMCNFEGNMHLPYLQDILGFHTLDNGFTFCGIYAGGDWEAPVFFIIYYDGKTLRGYIPEDGNIFNKKYMCAYGSEEDSPKAEELGMDDSVYDVAENMINVSPDQALIMTDIKKRISLKS